MKKLLLIALFASAAWAQNDDSYYPGATAVVSSLPATCTKVGLLVWLSTAPAGQNVYGSTTAGNPCTWTQLTGIQGPAGPPGPSGGGTGTVTVVGSGSLTSTRIVTGGGSQSAQTPSANATVDSGGNLTANSVATAAGNPVPFGPTTAAVSNGTCWNSATGLSLKDCGYVPVPASRTISTTAPLAGGGDLTANRTLTCTTCTVTIASGTATLGTGAISSGTCATAVTVTATGVAATDVLTAGFNSDVTGVTGYAPLSTGSLQIFPWPGTNTANFKVCNPSASSITPGAVTLNWKVVR